jgi:predicted HD phosphohydrolase
MDEGSDEDFLILAHVHEEATRRLPDLLLGMLTDLKGDDEYPIDRLAHSLEAATRARRAGVTTST